MNNEEKTQAINTLNSIINDYPKSEYTEKAFFELARLSIDAPEKALAQYEIFLSRYPDSPLAPQMERKRAQLLFDTGNYEDTYNAYQTLKEKVTNPEEIAFFEYQSIICQYRLNNLDEARKSAEEFATTYPDETDFLAGLLYERGEYYRRLQKHRKAENLYDEILSKYPYSAYVDNAEYSLAIIYILKEEYTEAMNRLNNIPIKYPNSEILSEVHFKLGAIQYLLEQYRLASDSFKYVIENNKTGNLLEEALFNLGLSYERMEEWNAALDTYTILLQKFPDKAERVHFKIAFIYFQMQKFAEALEYFRRVPPNTEDDEHNAEIQYWIGECYFYIGNYDTAVVEYLKVSYLYPKLFMWGLSAEYKAAIAYEQQRKFDEAKKIYQRIINAQGIESQWGIAAQERLDLLSAKEN